MPSDAALTAASTAARGPLIAVVGAGVTGLAAAYAVLQSDDTARVVVLEASDRVGGKLKRAEIGGVSVDVGAESMLARRPEGIETIERLGLSERLVHPHRQSALLRSGGVNVALPAATVMGIPTRVDTVGGVLSAEALQRLAAEPDAEPLTASGEDLSIGELVDARFGREVTDRLVEPLLGGVYAGHARHISLQASVPALHSALKAGGSLLEATRSVAAAGAAGGDPTRPVFASLSGGLATLAEALADAVAVDPRGQLRLRTAVRALSRTPSGYRLDLGAVGSGEFLDADAVIVGTPAGKSASLLADVAPQAAAELRGIETASMAIVTLAFSAADLGSLPPGSGLLIPPVEGHTVKAMTFSSQKWPGLGGGDDGVALLRGSAGRAGEEQVLQRDDAELTALLRRELAMFTGVTAEPVDAHVQRWGGGLPQYAVGHVGLVQRARAALADQPGLALAGASLDGVGIPACIASARAAASRVLQGLRRGGE